MHKKFTVPSKLAWKHGSHNNGLIADFRYFSAGEDQNLYDGTEGAVRRGDVTAFLRFSDSANAISKSTEGPVEESQTPEWLARKAISKHCTDNIGSPGCDGVFLPGDLDFGKILKICQLNEKELSPPQLDTELDGCSIGGTYLFEVKRLSRWVQLNSNLLSDFKRRYSIIVSDGSTQDLGVLGYNRLPWVTEVLGKGKWPKRNSGDVLDNKDIYRVNSVSQRLEDFKIPGCIEEGNCNLIGMPNGIHTVEGHHSHFHLNMEK